jgi:RimJ/RimL family protein N-acetyltransferase
MQHLRPLPTREASDAWVDFQIEHQSTHGFCMWATELSSSGVFVGAVGLLVVNFRAHFTPAVEIGWRLAREFWEQGLATEAGRKALEFGFRELALPEIVAHASVHNTMSHDEADDFNHPRVSESDPLRRQALYRLARNDWLISTGPTQRPGATS